LNPSGFPVQIAVQLWEVFRPSGRRSDKCRVLSTSLMDTATAVQEEHTAGKKDFWEVFFPLERSILKRGIALKHILAGEVMERS